MVRSQEDAAAAVVLTPLPRLKAYLTQHQSPALIDSIPSHHPQPDGYRRERHPPGTTSKATTKTKTFNLTILPLLIPTPDARPFVSSASSLSREGETSSGRDTPASAKLCPLPTRRQARSPCLIAVMLYLPLLL